MNNWAIQLSKTHFPKGAEANLFGVIIYTDGHAHTKKALKDQEYWDALHELSGPKWKVFATRALKGQWGLPDMPEGCLGMMMPVWKEPNSNKELLKAFNLENTKKLPLFVVFAEDENGNIESCTIKINDSTKESAYDSIKEIIVNISEALELVDPKYLNESNRAYHAVHYAIKNQKEWQLIKSSISLYKKLKSLK